MKIYVSLLIGFLLVSSTAFAQFTGPSATGRISTVTEARTAPVDTYVTPTRRSRNQKGLIDYRSL